MPDLVVVDLMMEELDAGFALRRACRIPEDGGGAHPDGLGRYHALGFRVDRRARARLVALLSS